MMESDPNIPPLPSPPPVIGELPPLLPRGNGQPNGLRYFLAALLSVALVLFFADGVLSVVDDLAMGLFQLRVFTAFDGLATLLNFLMVVLIYGLMALTPMIPKRVFLPFVFFLPASVVAMLLLGIYFYSGILWVGCAVSVCQIILALGLLIWASGGVRMRWPLVREEMMGTRGFSVGNLCGFVAANVFLLLPAAIFSLIFCGGLAINHFTDGFAQLRPAGFTMEMRKYARADGKTIELVPMSHIADAAFYRELSKSFPTNATVLMEGVTDRKNLLTNHITYKRMAKSLGVAEQQNVFKPRGDIVAADIDIEEFTPETIRFLNVVMQIHGQGLKLENLLKVIEYSAPPDFQEQLLDDLLRKRNRHLLGEIKSHLAESDRLIVPWGVAHMPEISERIQQEGFKLVEAKDHVAIGFFPGTRQLEPRLEDEKSK